MPLPIFQGDASILGMLQTRWASMLNPVIDNPAAKGIILPGIVLAVGSNSIDHRLGRKLQGWKVVRQNAVASLFDTQDSNTMPDLTLQLTSSAVVTISLEVF